MYSCLEGDKVIRVNPCYYYMDKPSVKTTISIDQDLWKKFSIRVIEEHGGRKKNDVIEELIKKYLKEK
jgi:metal-responsive CopG/Arc/MetJ family transcriptional regulator